MGNPLANDLETLRQAVERNARPGRFAQAFHLVPPVGWLNDPNGLCCFDGAYHAFFQYSPFNSEGGVKMWGHSVSDDLMGWEYLGTALYPDQPFDVSGVYSGCAYVEDGVMHVFYTGNVKREDADGYDYVNSGREANTVHVVSTDGMTFGNKHLVMTNGDYPQDDTNHVRDPKVWRSADGYRMVQGARRENDRGEVLVFGSSDLDSWELVNRVSTEYPFGYMWECPDYFELADARRTGAGATVKVLSVSPQGLEGQDWDRRNVYQSGYFVLQGDIVGACRLHPFALWDAGFDFYAPQTFESDDGRRILIGWMGMPDTDEYVNKTVEDGWQHCFTIPREVTAANGRVLQWPVRELDARHANERHGEDALSADGTRCFDLLVDEFPPSLDFAYVRIAEDLVLTWGSGTFEMRFLDEGKDSVGAGRTCRYEHLDGLRNMRVVGDVSSIEVFLNDGELTFSTRYYPESYGVRVDAPGASVTLWDVEA